MWLSHYFLKTPKFIGQKTFYIFSIFVHLEAQIQQIDLHSASGNIIVNERISFHLLKLFFQDDKK